MASTEAYAVSGSGDRTISSISDVESAETESAVVLSELLPPAFPEQAESVAMAAIIGSDRIFEVIAIVWSVGRSEVFPDDTQSA